MIWSQSSNLQQLRKFCILHLSLQEFRQFLAVAAVKPSISISFLWIHLVYIDSNHDGAVYAIHFLTRFDRSLDQ